VMAEPILPQQAPDTAGPATRRTQRPDLFNHRNSETRLMHQDFSLFATITVAVMLAFIGGFVARKLRLPSLVGYLVAGLLISPFTPGFTGDTNAAAQLAEMGVVFMMFGVGLHFSLKDLWNVRQIAIPGAILQ